MTSDNNQAGSNISQNTGSMQNTQSTPAQELNTNITPSGVNHLLRCAAFIAGGISLFGVTLYLVVAPYIRH